MDQVKIGKFIAELRKSKNLTQEQFAELLSVSSKSVSRWENGINMPDLSLLQEISEYFEINISELLNGRKMSKDELLQLKDTIESMLQCARLDECKKKNKLNKYFIAGLLCVTMVIIDNQFGIWSYIFKYDIPEFVNGALCGLGLLFEFIGFYNNNHKITLKERKKQLVNRK